MSVKLLTEHHLEFSLLKGGCTSSSESTLVKMPHCWKSHVTAHFIYPNPFSLGHPKSLEDFEYSDRDIGDIITSCVYNVSFLGVSGQVKFERTGDPMKNIKIEQIQGKHLPFYQFFF